jgi:hypothetical protein
MNGSGRLSNLRLVAPPRPARSDEYARASEEIETALRSLPGIVAVYATGSVSVPGISDLDRIAVIDEPRPVPPVWRRLPEMTRYVAMHTAFLVDRATFRRHRWFAYLEPLSISFGETVELDERPFSEYSEVLLGAESLTVSLLRVVKEVSTGRLKIRSFLCGLNNVRHALALARLGRDQAPAAWRIADDVTNLRQAWFESGEHEREELVKELASRAEPALLQALWALGEEHDSVERLAGGVRLRAPWSNVALASSGGRPSRVTGTPRVRRPFNLSARLGEVRWRRGRPEIFLHPAALALLAGPPPEPHREFRLARDELVRSYDEFLAVNRRAYSGIGFASPFLAS